MITLEASSLGEAWIKAMKIIMSKGVDVMDDDQRLREICNFCMTISHINDNDQILQQYADKKRIALMKEKYATCGLVGDYKVDYGSRVFNNHGINQLEWATKRIINKPETKSATFSLHEPGENMLPCLSLLDFKLRNGFVNMTAVYRSQNTFWSMPGNMLALNQMQEDVSRGAGCVTGKVELVVASAHIYQKDFETVEHILSDAINFVAP